MGILGTNAVLSGLVCVGLACVGPVCVGLLAACDKTTGSGEGATPDAGRADAGGQSSQGGFTQGGDAGQAGFTQGGDAGLGGAGASAGAGTAGAGGSSGAGGIVGTAGSAGTCEDPGETQDPQAEAFCAARTAGSLPCRDGTFEQCMSKTPSAVRELTIACCGAAFTAYVTCYVANGARCGTLGDVLASPVCSEVEETFQACLGLGDNCTQRISFGSSDIECDQYAATCGGAIGGPRDCTCTFGPHVGVVFSFAPPVDLVAAAAMYCK